MNKDDGRAVLGFAVAFMVLAFFLNMQLESQKPAASVANSTAVRKEIASYRLCAAGKTVAETVSSTVRLVGGRSPVGDGQLIGRKAFFMYIDRFGKNKEINFVWDGELHADNEDGYAILQVMEAGCRAI